MPAANHVVLASGAIVVVSVAVATAIAIYESPELRRYADDVRRRIAIALHSLGDGVTPPHREPLFNRPEDVHGFLQSARGEGAEPGVDADEETRRRQREELLYWNSMRVQKKEDEDVDVKDTSAPPKESLALQAGETSFDDFLRRDNGAETGTYIYKTGVDSTMAQDGLRRRGEGARGFASALYANPFADEHHIDNDELDDVGASLFTPGRDEIMSDIYSATTREDPASPRAATLEQSLISLEPSLVSAQTESSATVDVVRGTDEYVTAGQEDRQEAYASIQAWAHNSHPDFYSPLPTTPAAPISEPDLLSDGQLTPTDTSSLAGSAVDVADDGHSSRDGETGRHLDVMSESDGMLTPASWSEVGSVVSESEAVSPVHA